MKAWFISDTHGKHGLLRVPENIDIVFHAGDAGTVRDPIMNIHGMLDFLKWYRELKILNKVYIPGNHDTSIEHGHIKKNDFDGITFLNHEYAEVAGLKIFGSGYTPTFGTGWAYNVARHKIHERWKDIPDGLDILMTHGPAKGILDLTYSTVDGPPEQCGCKALLSRIREVNPRFHVFGHIHNEPKCPNAGILKVTGMETTFINAAVLNLDYELHNNGVVIEI